MASEMATVLHDVVTEWIRVWAHEMPAYQRKGWRLSHVRRGFPSEALLGPDYADCLMTREVAHG